MVKGRGIDDGRIVRMIERLRGVGVGKKNKEPTESEKRSKNKTNRMCNRLNSSRRKDRRSVAGTSKTEQIHVWELYETVLLLFFQKRSRFCGLANPQSEASEKKMTKMTNNAWTIDSCLFRNKEAREELDDEQQRQAKSTRRGETQRCCTEEQDRGAAQKNTTMEEQKPFAFRRIFAADQSTCCERPFVARLFYSQCV